MRRSYRRARIAFTVFASRTTLPRDTGNKRAVPVMLSTFYIPADLNEFSLNEPSRAQVNLGLVGPAHGHVAMFLGTLRRVSSRSTISINGLDTRPVPNPFPPRANRFARAPYSRNRASG